MIDILTDWPVAGWHSNTDAHEEKLWRHILQAECGSTDIKNIRKEYGDDPEGIAFFLAVDAAFCSSSKMQGCVPVHHELVQYLAGWCRNSARGPKERGGPIGEDANHFVRRAYKGFCETLRTAIKAGRLHSNGEFTYFGCFHVPQWMIDLCMDEVHEDAEYWNMVWDQDPALRGHVQVLA